MVNLKSHTRFFFLFARILLSNRDNSLSSSYIVTLPLGITAAEAGRLLSGVSEAAVLRLTHTRGLLCGIGGRPKAAREFNRLARTLLRAPPWCTRCSQREGCPKKLAEWLTPEQIGSHRGVGEWCLRTPLPPAFQPGQCVLNI